LDMIAENLKRYENKNALGNSMWVIENTEN
jgi:hypothetical protein